MKTINDFIKELQEISPNKRELPLVITCPNGLQVDPEIKMQTKDGMPSFVNGSPVEKMVITY